MYQAYLGVILGLFVIYTISQFLREKNVKDILLEVLKDIVTIGIGIIIYYLILKVILAILGLSLASYKGADSLGINTIKALPKSIIQTYRDFYNFFFTNKIIRNSYYKRMQINSALFMISLIGLILNFVSMKREQKDIKNSINNFGNYNFSNSSKHNGSNCTIDYSKLSYWTRNNNISSIDDSNI